MPVEGQFNPNESVRKVRQLITRGDIWTQEVILVITNTDIIIRDGSTRVRASTYHRWNGQTHQIIHAFLKWCTYKVWSANNVCTVSWSYWLRHHCSVIIYTYLVPKRSVYMLLLHYHSFHTRTTWMSFPWVLWPAATSFKTQGEMCWCWALRQPVIANPDYTSFSVQGHQWVGVTCTHAFVH